MKRVTGFTLVEIMIVVAILGALAAIAVPAFLKARDNSLVKSCVSNLRQIGSAKDQFGMDNFGTGPGDLDSLVSTYIKRRPACKGGGTYTMNDINTDPTCSVGGGHTL